MSTLTAAPAPAPALKVTQARVLRSEFTKFTSLRSTLWTLLAAVVLMIGLGLLFCAVTGSQYHTFGAAQKLTFDAASTSLTGATFAQIAFGVLEAVERYNRSSAVHATQRTRAEFARFFAGLELIGPGIAPLGHWQPGPVNQLPDQGLPVFTAVGRKH